MIPWSTHQRTRHTMTQNTKLARRINLPLLIFYGLGTILGAGIYVLVGKVAGSAGLLAPLSFIIAALIAWLTAMSYSQLVVLFPQSAGEAVYVEHGFHRPWLTLSTGIMIILTGIVSAATLTLGFVGYLVLLLPIDETLAMVTAIFLLGALAAWGIAESLILAAFITVVEISGLCIVLFFCGDSLAQLPERANELFVPNSMTQIAGVLSGAFLAFYAFIGFEDMVNVVEEVKQPETTLPKAIFWVVIIATSLYVLIALVATLSMPLAALEQSAAPLADLLNTQNASAAKVVAFIGMFAIVNGVLIQIIMASRVCYGLSRQYGGPAFLHSVSPTTRTPIVATVLIATLILISALFFPLTTLAKSTSFIILIIFSLINIALWRMRAQPVPGRSYPLIAASLCLALLAFQVNSVL
jgi:amino acid transporter